MVPKPPLAVAFEVPQLQYEENPSAMLDGDNCSPADKDKFAPSDLLHRPWHRSLVVPRRSIALELMRVAEALGESRTPRQKVERENAFSDFRSWSSTKHNRMADERRRNPVGPPHTTNPLNLNLHQASSTASNQSADFSNRTSRIAACYF